MAFRLRKTMGSYDAPCIRSLLQLMESQSKETIARWCLGYAEAEILPIFEKRCPGDLWPRRTLEAARAWFSGLVKLPAVKHIILNECHAAARELAQDPAAQAAARAVGQAASCCHVPGHALGLAFYGGAAVAYDRVGLEENAAVYERIAEEACEKMASALRETAAAQPHGQAGTSGNAGFSDIPPIPHTAPPP